MSLQLSSVTSQQSQTAAIKGTSSSRKSFRPNLPSNIFTKALAVYLSVYALFNMAERFQQAAPVATEYDLRYVAHNHKLALQATELAKTGNCTGAMAQVKIIDGGIQLRDRQPLIDQIAKSNSINAWTDIAAYCEGERNNVFNYHITGTSDRSSAFQKIVGVESERGHGRLAAYWANKIDDDKQFDEVVPYVVQAINTTRVSKDCQKAVKEWQAPVKDLKFSELNLSHPAMWAFVQNMVTPASAVAKTCTESSEIQILASGLLSSAHLSQRNLYSEVYEAAKAISKNDLIKGCEQRMDAVSAATRFTDDLKELVFFKQLRKQVALDCSDPVEKEKIADELYWSDCATRNEIYESIAKDSEGQKKAEEVREKVRNCFAESVKSNINSVLTFWRNNFFVVMLGLGTMLELSESGKTKAKK